MVAEVEVVRERDGSCRGFAFVTFQDKKHADMLKRQHHTNIGNVRMEGPCVPPRFAVPSHIRFFSSCLARSLCSRNLFQDRSLFA